MTATTGYVVSDQVCLNVDLSETCTYTSFNFFDATSVSSSSTYGVNGVIGLNPTDSNTNLVDVLFGLN